MLERASGGLLDLDAIDSVLTRHPGAAGTGRLREACAIYRDPAFFRARSERLFKALVGRRAYRSRR